MNEKNSFAICIPTLNRIDYLIPALLYYSIDFTTTEIYIYDNGKQRIAEKMHDFVNIRSNRNTYPSGLLENLIVMGGKGENIGVSKAWNILLGKVFENHTHALVLNDDIYFGKTEFHINNLINNNAFKSDLTLCESDFDWSAFILPRTTFNTVGAFDENLVIYFSDNDYYRRVSMPNFGLRVTKVPFLNPTIFRRSMSLLKSNGSNELKDIIELDKAYYIKKWGGDVGIETYLTPFGQENKINVLPEDVKL